MSKDDRELIERLRGLLAKATPVPWEAQGTQTEGEDLGVSIIGLRLDDAGEPMYTPTNGIVAAALPCPTEIDDNDYTRVEANAALLVAAVNNLPALLTRLEALQAQPVGELRQALERIASAKLVLEKYGDQTPLRCQSCAYRGHVTDEERHSENCPRQIALAALTASPPVVERGDARILVDQFVRDLTRSIDRGCGPLGFVIRSEEQKPLADAILALTPVEGVGMRDALSDAVTEIVALREWIDQHVPCDLIASENWGKLHRPLVTTTVLRNARAALSTPVAQGDEVRERLLEALTPHGETKAAYMGEFSWTEWLPDENGVEQGHERTVPWTTIKEIMAAIRDRASVEKLDEADALATLTKGARDAG